MHARRSDPPRFCGQCGAALPEGAQFCIECGSPARGAGQEPRREGPALRPEAAAPRGAVTVRLPNARSAQSVVGGTVKLPTSGAVPPGLWFRPEPPGAEDAVAVCVPLRAVKGGWSGLTSHGWRRVDRSWAGDGTSRDVVRFEVEREWFAADGCASGLRLRVRIGAASHAAEGRERLGFRYRLGRNPPMSVLDARWLDAEGRERRELAVPQIQLMAPPRVPRVSDFQEEIRSMGAREANEWALGGAVHGVFELIDSGQQRTPFGRGLRLAEITGGRGGLLGRLLQQRYRVRIERPIVCDAVAVAEIRGRAQEEARGLGLDMESDAVVEWWLERQGYDGGVLEPGAHSFGDRRVAVVFRRAQIAKITGFGLGG
ncbi:MAG: zinc ribbon domain-containing protein [Chloroflexota bacterium]